MATKTANAAKATETNKETKAAPKLGKAASDKLTALCGQFLAAESDIKSMSNAQRLTLMNMAKVGAFDACWPIVAEQLATQWAESTIKFAKSMMNRYWKATAANVAFPEVDQAGWQNYARGALQEVLVAEGVIEQRAPRPAAVPKDEPKAASKAESVDTDEGAQASTVAKGLSSAPDIVSAMAELANKLKVVAGDNRAALAVLANVVDDIHALQGILK